MDIALLAFGVIGWLVGPLVGAWLYWCGARNRSPVSFVPGGMVRVSGETGDEKQERPAPKMARL